jgi:dTDP-3,4-didehydro-2,6-dideoxy-alpha-D-glucose 3-reductase
MDKPIKILILGYSYIVQKAILNAIEKTENYEIAGIASKTKYNSIPEKYKSYDSYEKAIDNSGCDVVYISTHNSSHCELIRYCLNKNKHVICDKPAVLTKNDAVGCFKLARNLLIFESIAYPYHKQHILIQGYLNALNPVQKMTVHFGFPPLDKNNFRNYPEYGGGCLYDLGPYAISAGRLYFKQPAKRIYCDVFYEKKLPISASVMIHYGGNNILQAHLGFQLEYKNQLDLWGHGFNISLDRAFTIPPNLANTIRYKARDELKMVAVEQCDHFQKMFEHFRQLFYDNDLACNKRFIEQAIQLDAMANSAQGRRIITVDYGDMR